MRNNIICRFVIPKRLLFDNGCCFMNMHLREVLNDYEVDHVKSSLYYPKKCQVKTTNKSLLSIFNSIVYEEPKKWADTVSLALWA